MSPMLSSAANQAEQLRQDGNSYFKKYRFGAAIDAYTEAITLCPNVPVYWTNRALCHRKRNDWQKVEDDCKRALELDSSSVKAHCMLGLALLRRENFSEGIRELEKALDLGRGGKPNGYMVEEIWQELAKAKYQEWEQASTLRMWELQHLREACEASLKEKHIVDSSKREGFLDELAESMVNRLEALRGVFRKAAENDIPVEVPDYLCCKITLDILRDPVITPSGITYERAVILDHLHKVMFHLSSIELSPSAVMSFSCLKVGKFDPVTRGTLHESELVPNLAIKEAVEAYLGEHGWAYI